MEEVPGDFTLWTYPDFKGELYEMAAANGIGLSRTELINYTYQTLMRLGVPEHDIHDELDDLAQDSKYVKAQAESDNYWEMIFKISQELFKNGFYPHLDTFQGEILDMKRHIYAKGLISKLLGLWKTQILASDVVVIPIRVFSIHSPKIEGSVCTYSDTDKKSAIGSYTMRLFGIGGGGKMKANLQIGADYEARNGNCYNIIKKAKIKIEQCVELYKGEECEKYLRSTPLEIERGYEKIPLDSQNDACTELDEFEEEYICFDLSKARDSDKQTLTISKEMRAEFDLDFDFNLLQTKCGIKVETSSFTEKKLTYVLPGLHKYRGFKLKNDFGYVWSVR